MKKLVYASVIALLTSVVLVAQTFTPLVPKEHAAPFQSGDVWHHDHAEASRVNFNTLWAAISTTSDCDNPTTSKVLFDSTLKKFSCGTDAGGTGVTGPGSSTDNAIARWDGAGGTAIQNSGITIADGASGTLSNTNSGDVTLAGTPNYLTIAAQVITRALIDLTSHVTGDLPYANLTPATGATKLLGRGQGAGAGDWQEITLGSGLSMSGNTMTAAGGGGGGAPDNALYVTLATDATLVNERVLTAGSGITVTDAGAGSTVTVAGGLFARKTADESVTSSTTLQSDDTLTFAIGVSEVLTIDYFLRIEGSTAGDIKFNLAIPAGATYLLTGVGLLTTAVGNDGDARFLSSAGSGFDPNYGTIGAASPLPLHLHAVVVNSTTAGNVVLQWAQLVSDGTATKVLINSHGIAVRR